MIPENKRSVLRIVLNRCAKFMRCSDKKNGPIVFSGLFLAYIVNLTCSLGKCKEYIFGYFAKEQKKRTVYSK